MNDICIDIDYSQVYKHGQRIGGDVFLLSKSDAGNIVTATLSDGLGSGVKANVLASLTTHMANKMSFSAMDINRSAEIIMDTLPVDREKGISYSTFTIARVTFSDDKSYIHVSLIEYDNPESLRFRGADPLNWDRTANTLNRQKAVKKETVYSSEFDLQPGDRLIYFSDGVAQSGVRLGSVVYDEARGVYTFKQKAPDAGTSEVGPQGWGVDSVREFVRKQLRANPDISSRDLSRAIVTQACTYDDQHPNDDITCVVVGVRKPRRTLIVTGAPRNRDSDRRLAEIISNYEGSIIVCGGTTAKIVARELRRQILPDHSPAGELPPCSTIAGIDLVTEGMLTLSAAADRLSRKTVLMDMPEDAARRIIRILRDTDQVQFIVGTQINDETSDPVLAARIGVRMPVIDQMTRALEELYFKEVEVSYL